MQFVWFLSSLLVTRSNTVLWIVSAVTCRALVYITQCHQLCLQLVLLCFMSVYVSPPLPPSPPTPTLPPRIVQTQADEWRLKLIATPIHHFASTGRERVSVYIYIYIYTNLAVNVRLNFLQKNIFPHTWMRPAGYTNSPLVLQALITSTTRVLVSSATMAPSVACRYNVLCLTNFGKLGTEFFSRLREGDGGLYYAGSD